MTSPFAKDFDPTMGDGRKLWDMATRPIPNPYTGSANQANAAFDAKADDLV